VAAKAGVWGKRSEYERVNVQGTLNCVQACRENSVPALVYTSTPSVVFDGRDINGGDETLAYARRPLCQYAVTKILAEQHVLTANSPALKTVAIRPHLVWGPGDPHLLPRLIARARAGRLKIIGNGLNRVDITYIDNVVEAHILAAQNLLESATAAGQAFFIGQEEPVYLWHWINTLLATAGLNRIEKRIPYQAAYLLGLALEGAYRFIRVSREPPMTRFVAQQLARSHWFNHEKAKKVLGFRDVVSIPEGMDKFFLEWRAGKE
jgi:nucleoside-diphosphate-sugar epimerase